MRILYFTRDYTTHDRRFLEKLAQSRHEIFFLRLEDDGVEYERRPPPDEIVVVPWQGGREPVKEPEDWLRLMPDFSRVMNKIRPDLVHAGPVQSCAFMTALSGFRPLLAMSWGSDMLVDARRNELWEWMTKYTLERTDFVFCDCMTVRKAVCRMVPFADESILQFCWGVDLTRFAPGPNCTDLKDRPGWKDSIVVLTTRSWEPLYGPDIALEAFSRAFGENNKMRLIMLGSGSMKQDLEHRIHMAGLNDFIYRPGYISHDQISNLFKAADLYLSCSYSDGSSISLMEAMATGLPVIVTDNPSNREWVQPGCNGWLATAGKPEQFGALLVEAASLEREKRSAIGSLNRMTVQKSADGDAMFSRLLDLYNRIEREITKYNKES